MSPLARIGLFCFCDPNETVFPILASTKCDCKVPLSHPDEVLVGAGTVKVGRTSFTQEYRVFSTAQNCVTATGEGIIVCVDKATGQPVAVPDDMRASIERTESTR